MTDKRRESLQAMSRAKSALGEIMAQDTDDDRNNRPIFMLLAAELTEIWSEFKTQERND